MRKIVPVGGNYERSEKVLFSIVRIILLGNFLSIFHGQFFEKIKKSYRKTFSKLKVSLCSLFSYQAILLEKYQKFGFKEQRFYIIKSVLFQSSFICEGRGAVTSIRNVRFPVV